MKRQKRFHTGQHGWQVLSLVVYYNPVCQRMIENMCSGVSGHNLSQFLTCNNIFVFWDCQCTRLDKLIVYGSTQKVYIRYYVHDMFH